jgi:hypothetical protein
MLVVYIAIDLATYMTMQTRTRHVSRPMPAYRTACLLFTFVSPVSFSAGRGCHWWQNHVGMRALVAVRAESARHIAAVALYLFRILAYSLASARFSEFAHMSASAGSDD